MNNLEILKVGAGDAALISNDYMKVGGQAVKIAPQAVQDIIKLSNLNKSAVRKLNKNFSGTGGFKIANEIIRRNNDSLRLIIDKSDMTIARVTNKAADISRDAFEQTMAHAIDNNSDIRLTNSFELNAGTTYKMQMVNSNPKDIGLVGENIALGKAFTWDIVDGISSQETIIREICTNGMVGEAEVSHSMKDMTVDGLYNEILKQLLAEDQDLINAYMKQVNMAATTNLSAAEWELISNFLLRNYNADSDLIKRYIGDDRWQGKYLDRGIDINQLTWNQKKNCPTPVNTWDAINCLTWVSSHEMKSKPYDEVGYQAQLMAHKKLYGTYDALAYVPNVPNFKREGPRMSDFIPTVLN